MGRKIIVGLDPGTTTAYAIMGINGNILALKSSKQLNLDVVIKETTEKGLPLIVGTDKRKFPRMVCKYAAKTGAVKISPEYDLPEFEKNLLTRGLKAKNGHQKDALAAATIAYKHYYSLIKRVYKYLSKKEKVWMVEEVLQIVIQKKVSIDKAHGVCSRTIRVSSV